MRTLARTLGTGGLGALAVAIAVLAVRPAPALGAPTNGGGEPPARTITVSGSGTLTLSPDVAHVGLGITASRPTVEAARTEAARVMSAIIAAARAKGVAEKDIRTSGVSLSPQYGPDCSSYAPSGSACAKPGTIVGYTMNEQVDVTVRDLGVVGAVVDAATAAGATNVNGIAFEVDDPSKAETDARLAAIRAAHDKADAMARAAGVSLGQVISISETSVPFPNPYAGYAAGKAVDSAATPVQPGTQDLEATVTMVYAIG
jgi:uncharacterized protein